LTAVVKRSSLLLSQQGHLAPLLRAIGPAFDIALIGRRFSAGKSRCAEIVVYVGGGKWYAHATVAGLRAVRADAPILLGIDEGDEAERDNPGVKGYLLEAHDWNATSLKFSDPNEKGKRSLEETGFGGAIVITFRKRPWPAVASRAFMPHMEPAGDYRVSDDGDGMGFRMLLGPSVHFCRMRCEEALRDKNELWAMRRTHEPDFVERLNRIVERAGATILRQRAFARSVLFIAELLGFDTKRVEERLTEGIASEEVESENATVIEAIEADPLFQLEEVGVEELRLSVQKRLRESREFIDLSRNRFAEVLKEMGFSKQRGPTWKRVERDGREFMALFPRLWQKEGVRGAHMERPQTPQTTLPAAESHNLGPGEAVLATQTILRELCDGPPPSMPCARTSFASARGSSSSGSWAIPLPTADHPLIEGMRNRPKGGSPSTGPPTRRRTAGIPDRSGPPSSCIATGTAITSATAAIPRGPSRRRPPSGSTS
jgi:hypothetical protein